VFKISLPSETVSELKCTTGRKAEDKEEWNYYLPVACLTMFSELPL
jgi:hypothetical protein